MAMAVTGFENLGADEIAHQHLPRTLIRSKRKHLSKDIQKLKKALVEIEKKLDQVVNHPVTKDLRNFSSGGAVAALDDDFDVIFKSVISGVKQARDKLGQYVQNLIEAQKRKRKEIAAWFCANSKHHYRIHSAIEFSGPDLLPEGFYTTGCLMKVVV